MSNDTQYSYQYDKVRVRFTPFTPMDELGGYDPMALIESLKQTFALRTDNDLARLLDVTPALLSKVRNLRIAISADLLIRMHDKTGLTIDELRRRLGVAQ